MQAQLLTNPAQGFAYQQQYEYLLVVNPAATVAREVMNEKELFSTKYKARIAAKTLPHITVANFLAKESMEDTIMRYMHRIISVRKSFAVTLNNYSGFIAHTIYIRVQQQAAFRQLAAELKPVDQYIQGNGFGKAQLVTNAHVTIARRLEKSVYDAALAEYARKTFYASFEVSELVLLRREGQFAACERLNVFKLLPDETLNITPFAERCEDSVERLRQGVMSF